MAHSPKSEESLQSADLRRSSTREAKRSGGRRKLVGNLGEALAAQYFEQNGHAILERNWRPGRFAEIDLIVRRRGDGLIIFVEVKTRCRRSWQDFSSIGFQTIDWRKRHKILTAARRYLHLARYGDDVGYQCDAVLVSYTALAEGEGGEIYLVEPDVLHIGAAFDNV